MSNNSTIQSTNAITFDQLADRIILVDKSLRQQAAHAVNCMLTARNWFIGCYIVEFEQHGADRAQYGEQLLKTESETRSAHKAKQEIAITARNFPKH